MSINKRNTIHINDCVKIINPETVVRWGYPLTKEIVKETIITQEQKDLIKSMIREFLTPAPYIDSNGIGTMDLSAVFKAEEDDYPYNKILDELSYVILKQNNFGGRERKLYTEVRSSLRNKSGYVCDRRVVKSGIYCHGSSSYDEWNGDYDYEPPRLEDEKTHVLFKIHVNYYEDVCPNINADDGGVWFEKKNLEKIQ